MNINFNLRDPQSIKETPINLVLRYKGYQVVLPTLEKINPSNWENDKTKGKNYQTAKRSHPNHVDINARLNDIKGKSTKAYYKFIEDNCRIPTPSELKTTISFALGHTVPKEDKQITFFEFIESHILESAYRTNQKTGKTLSPNTIKPYKTVQGHLISFQNEYSIYINWDTLDNVFYKAFTEYLRKKKNLKPNSIAKQFQNINAFIKQAELNDIIPFGKIRSFQISRVDVDNIHLTKDELADIEKLDLSGHPKLERTRDVFLMACYTAARYSDWHSLNADAIVSVGNRKMFNIIQQKTQQGVSIPVDQRAMAILNKYDGRLPRIPSCQKVNDYLKDICKLVPSLNNTIQLKYKKGTEDIVECVPKYQLVTSHTARRTFATLNLEAGIPPFLIMAITGHKTEKDFWKYVKLDNQAKSLQYFELMEKLASIGKVT